MATFANETRRLSPSPLPLPSHPSGPGVKALGDSPDLSDDHFILAKGNLHDNGQAHCVISASHCATPIHMLIFCRTYQRQLVKLNYMYAGARDAPNSRFLRPYLSPLMGVAALRPNLFSTLCSYSSSPPLSPVPLSSALLAPSRLSFSLVDSFYLRFPPFVLKRRKPSPSLMCFLRYEEGKEGGNANWGLSGDVWGGEGEYALAECLCGRGNLTAGPFLPDDGNSRYVMAGKGGGGEDWDRETVGRMWCSFEIVCQIF